MSRKITLSVILIGLIAILATSIYYELSSRGFSMSFQSSEMTDNSTAQMPPSNAPSAPMNMSAMFTKEDIDPEMAKRAGELMMKMQENPNDIDTLLELSLLFYQAEDYLAMLNFANRAAALAPMNARAGYFAGIAHSQLGEFNESAQAFERSLSLQENPSTRYSLAVLYIYNLNDKEKARMNLEEALKSTMLQEGLKSKIEAELAGL